jgi:hypothetical protein
MPEISGLITAMLGKIEGGGRHDGGPVASPAQMIKMEH